MAYAVLVPNKIEATNRDVLNRSFVSASAIENGMVLSLTGKSAVSGYGEAWTATWPTTGSLVDVWMALSPEIVNVTAADGTVYRGLNDDPRNFILSASAVGDAFKPQPGDIITMTADAFTGAYAAGSTHASAAFQEWQLQWRAFDQGDALTLKYLGTTYVSIGTGNIDNQRITAYKMEVVRNQ